MFDALLAEFASPFRAMPAEVAALRLLAAMVLGGVIGLERELAARAAGLRTHMLIAIAACLFTLITFEMLALPALAANAEQADPLRLIEAVTAGVAFLAAGTIFTARGKVNGLTTGAGMWLAGAIGLACGIGLIPLAAIATLLAVIILSALGWIERSITGAKVARAPAAPDDR